MNVKRLCLENVGQIRKADIEFGDLTVFVGPQATGKTLFLEMLKLVIDTGHIHSELGKHGFDWGGKVKDFLRIFLGEGMEGVWVGSSGIRVNDSRGSLESYIHRRRKAKESRMFYIPSQRVLTLANGWPRPFQSYGAQDPFVVREFSEKFRLMMDKEFSRGGSLFPQTNRLKRAYRVLLEKGVFGDFELGIETHGAQRRLVLSKKSEGSAISFMAWSAGQREFVPLLLGLYWLLPAARIKRRGALRWVVIEEVEMGLHPSAISTVLLIVLELMSRGYQVCLSTHSPHVLDVVWCLRILREHRAIPDRLLELFECRKTPQTRKVAEMGLRKTARVYYFDRDNGQSRDISNLDPGALNEIEAGWGGLTEFSGRVTDTVASVVEGAVE